MPDDPTYGEYAQFCEEQRPGMLAYALARLKDEADAVDVVSDTEEAMYGLWPTLAPEHRRPTAWKILHNKINDVFRKRDRNRRALETLAAKATRWADPETRLDSLDEAQWIQHVLCLIPEIHRNCLGLIFWAGLEHAEIHDILADEFPTYWPGDGPVAFGTKKTRVTRLRQVSTARFEAVWIGERLLLCFGASQVAPPPDLTHACCSGQKVWTDWKCQSDNLFWEYMERTSKNPDSIWDEFGANRKYDTVRKTICTGAGTVAIADLSKVDAGCLQEWKQESDPDTNAAVERVQK